MKDYGRIKSHVKKIPIVMRAYERLYYYKKYKEWKIKKKDCVPKINVKKTQYKELCDFYEKIVDDIVAKIKHEQVEKIELPSLEFGEYSIISRIGDYMGPVCKKDDSFYKLINKTAIDEFFKLWETGLLQVLSKLKLIPEIVITKYKTKDYPLILKLETLDLTMWNEVDLDTFSKMLLCTTLIQQICRKSGCVLHDPTMYNYALTGNKYIYFDIGSFRKVDDTDKIKDYSMVVLGIYRLIFSYFPSSSLYYFELDGFRPSIPLNSVSLNYFEFIYWKKTYLKRIKHHSSKIAYKAACRILKDLICCPADVAVLFCNSQKIDFL